MRITDTSDLWWKNAVVYCLDVATFMDWNDDGVGDFEGLAHRLDYLSEIGVTCLWLMPFFASPERDDGYDVADYYDVDGRLGHLGDLLEIIRTAKDRGMRVIADLVVSHTSDRHPWFVQSRSSRDNPFRDFYVWRDEPPAGSPANVFPGEEDGVWQHDERTGQYYLHHFYKEQPDLNMANPKVRDEVAKIVGFWMQMGLSGFRVDAVPYLVDPSSAGAHSFLRSLRSYVSRRSGEAMLLGEVNLPYDRQLEYFGGPEGNELTMQFDFLVMQRLYLALAREDARPLADALLERPALAPENQWATFVRNHDELTLDRLTDDERAEVFAAFAPDESMRAYGRGIVRRLPTMLEGDEQRIRMVYSLLFSLPGTPVLFYGEEIGMGENPAAPGRLKVRSPMQWSTSRHGGFSNADRLVGPVVEGRFGPEHVNVSQQRHDPGSMLQFVRRLVERYRNSAEIGWGELTLLDHEHPSVLAHALEDPEGRMIALHNFSREPRELSLAIDRADASTRFVDLLAGGEHRLDERGRLSIRLEGHGFRWLRVLGPDAKRLS